jgi:SAM-dependent methyltransferase
MGIRSTLTSFARATTQRLNRLVPIHGINVGGGAWVRLGWYNADTRHSVDAGAKAQLDAASRFPFADGSIALVFSSHFFEHVNDDTARNLFREAFRVLRPGGVLRISVPDFELATQRYAAGDDAFFDGGDIGLAPRYQNWAAHGVAPTLENKLSFLFFNYGNKDERGQWPPWAFDPSYYCGPANADPERIRTLARSNDVAGLSRYLVGLAPKDAFDYGHINWWTEPKFRELLGGAGFRQVMRSTYRGSSVRELRGAAFDNRPALSLFVEAVK